MSAVLKKLEVFCRKVLFKIFSPGVTGNNVHSHIPADELLSSILIMRQDRIGDMIMTLPLIREIGNTYTDIRIGIVASESNGIILKYEKDLEIITYRKDPGGFVSSLLEARNFSPDAVVDMHMHDSTTSFIYALASGARWKLHIDRENRLPFNTRVKAPQDGHIMDAFAGLLSGLGKQIKTASLRREVNLSSEETGFAENFWNGSGISPESFVAVNISAGGENREWAASSYARVCGSILKLGLKPLLIYSPRDSDFAEAIHRSEPGTVVSPVTPSILHLAALIRNVSLLVSPDTSVIHLAASYGIPVVGMYLPFDPSLPGWYPWDVNSEILKSLDNSSLDSVTPEMVSEAVRKLVSTEVHNLHLIGDQ